MKMGRSLVLGIAGSMMISSGAMAADVPPLVVAAPPPPPMAAPAFDWGGFYVGAFGGAWFELGDTFTFDWLRAGVLAGANYQIGDNFIAGLEVTGGLYDFDDVTWEWGVAGRVGIVAGDNFLLFILAGLFADSDDYEYLHLGGGIEFGIGERLAIRADVLFEKEIGEVFDYISITAGLSWYLGN